MLLFTVKTMLREVKCFTAPKFLTFQKVFSECLFVFQINIKLKSTHTHFCIIINVDTLSKKNCAFIPNQIKILLCDIYFKTNLHKIKKCHHKMMLNISKIFNVNILQQFKNFSYRKRKGFFKVFRKISNAYSN